MTLESKAKKEITFMTNQIKILVVDDETDLLTANKMLLEQAGFKVSIASNGFDALRFLSQEKYDAILTDYLMKEMDGMQFSTYVKVNNLNSMTPIFVISGHLNELTIDKLRKVGVIGFIRKPYDIKRVINIIKSKTSKPNKIGSYDPSFIKMFQAASVEWFEHYFPGEVSIIETTDLNNNLPLGSFSSVLPIYGRSVFGYNAVYANSDVLRLLCIALFGIESGDYGERFLLDLIGEINNNISGGFKLYLNKKNINVQIGLPVSMHAYPQSLSILPSYPRSLISIKIKNAQCHVEFCLGDSSRIADMGDVEALQVFKYTE